MSSKFDPNPVKWKAVLTEPAAEYTIRYCDIVTEFNVDWKAESSTRY